jgi:hypothetical protein
MAAPDSAPCRTVPQVERSRGTTSEVNPDSGGGVEHGDDLIFRYVMALSLAVSQVRHI